MKIYNLSKACSQVFAGTFSRFIRELSVAVLIVWGATTGHAAVLINLDATGQPAGPLAVWPNTGTLSGDFNPFFDTPAVITVDGVKGVAFRGGTTGQEGTSYFGPTAPETMCGNASRTIEAWIWNPTAQNEKTVFSWGRRGGPNGSNSTFGHGVHNAFGCFGGWGYADLAYTNGLVVFGRWTYIVYTYNGTTSNATAYIDGVQSSTENYTANGGLITHTNDTGGFPIPLRVARHTEANGLPSNSGVGTNVIAKVRLHDTALSAAQIQAQFDSEKTQFGLVDTDSDGMPDWWEIRYGLDKNVNDANQDADSDSSSNLQEFQRNTIPNDADTDDDGAIDGAETKTGVFVSLSNIGTDPLNPDTDADGLKDGVETGTNTYVSPTNTGTNPNIKDSDGDSWEDGGEVLLGSNPTLNSSIPTAPSWAAAVTVSQPKYWYRFEENDPTQTCTNYGSATNWQGAYGTGILATDMGKVSALPSLGKALEFTGPASPSSTTKYVDMAAVAPQSDIPELVNLRSAPVDKTTTVEYWFKTTQVGTHGNNSWQSPSIMAHESPGDGDMYWGKINDVGEFGFSTSDQNDILTQRDMGKDVTDGNWHHLVMIKEWHVNAPNISRMYLDGGPLQPGGASFTKTLGAGTGINYQDNDSLIRYLGFTQSGELENVQFIGFLDEVVIYDRALTESEVRLHSQAVLGADTDSDGMSDVYEINNGLNPNNAADANQDADSDGSTNLQEYQRGTNPQDSDSDDDGVNDGAETDTGVWVSPTNRGTDPLDPDTDNDGLLDGVETNTGVFVNPGNTGSNPLLRDSDSDTWSDADEVALNTNPNNATQHPVVPPSWAAAVQANNPIHWLRFEETNTVNGVTNLGSAAAFYSITFGSGILDADLAKPSANTNLGRALEFTGPATNNLTAKYVDFGAVIPELVNLRSAPEEGKATTVEYWIKTTQRGSQEDRNWQSPALFAHESPSDGDMFWGVINAGGNFTFSTSDTHECRAGDGRVTDGKWHHIVMSKIWHTNSPCISRLYIDGGEAVGGVSVETTTDGGAGSMQDDDSQIQYLGFTQNGELGDVQYIGLIDEVVIYTNAFFEAQARLHYLASGLAPAVPIGIHRVGQSVILTWPQGTLQSADNLNGPWSPVPGATAPYTNAITPGNRFFRVVQ